jgi:subtilisin family serine protease
MARSTKRAASTPFDGTSGLGIVVRFTPKASGTGVAQLERGGFRVASTKDFMKAESVPNDFDGADVQYFERFGIAIVRRDGDRLKPMLENAMQQKMVSAARPERTYRALGGPTSKTLAVANRTGADFGTTVPRDYLLGYRDGVHELVERLVGGQGAEARIVASAFDETSSTWGLQAVKVLESGFTGAGIKIAVLDTGFDDTHQDFVGRKVVKKLFASRSAEEDVHGHGTHCIGTACGPLQPAAGPRYGIAHDAEIYAGKVLGDDGFGTDRSIIAGMEWALEEGCHIISMSLGAETSLGDSPSDDYEQIGQVCLDAGTLIVAAAGNESTRPGRIAPIGSPSNASTILAVSAVDRSFTPGYFSCGGMNPGQEVDIAAPGVGILSSLPGNSYDRWDGTSMATPHVAGVAALIAESDAKFRGWALWARLIQITKPLSSPARDVGKGLLQAK